MSRSIARAVTAVTAAATVAAAALVGAPAANAAPAITGLSAAPVATSKVTVSWNAYTGFTVDHYVAKLVPGSRIIEVGPAETSATFNDLTWGTGYTAKVVACDNASCSGQVSDEATLVLPGAQLSASISKPTAVRGDRVTISGTLRWTATGKPIRNADIEVQAAYAPFPPYAYQSVTTVSTNRNGSFATKVKASRSAVYRVFFGRANTAGSFDGSMDLAVRAPMSLGFSSNPVSFGRQVAFSGSFDAPGSLVAGSVVRLQQQVNGRWKSVKSTTATAKGGYRILYTPTSRIDVKWRVWSEAGPSFATSSSQGKLLTVR